MLNHTERSTLSQARDILLRETLQRSREGEQLQELQDWANAEVTHDGTGPSEAERALLISALASDELDRLHEVDRFAQEAIDHIDRQLV